MSTSTSSALGESEKAEHSSIDNLGPSPSSGFQLDSQFEKAVGSTQDERKMSLSINLKQQTSPANLGTNPPLNSKERLEEGAADVPPGHAKEEKNFNTLPAELRVKIYKMTWEPRRVNITRFWLAGPEDLLEHEFLSRTEHRNIHEFFEEDHMTTLTTSAAPLPVTLWINEESRYETLQHYEIAFACPKNGSSHVYFNFEIDELEILRHGALKSALSREDLARVKGLIVPMGHKGARSSNNTLDHFRDTEPIDDLDEQLIQLHNLGLSTGLEPYNPNSVLEDAELRRLAERLQQEIANRLRLPSKLSAACPSLERILLRPTATCGYWPRDVASVDDEDRFFLRGDSECLTCTLHWTARHLGFLVIGDPEQQAWSVGDACRPEQGKTRETRMGQVTASWYARVDSAAWEWDPEDERATRRTVADWALAATAVANKLVDPSDAEPIYVI